MAKVKIKDGENITPATVERVISLLNQDKPITKKSACEILNISYNTARLGKIIEEYIERKEYTARKKKEIRNKPITKDDIKYIIESYLSGDALLMISEAIFRSTGVVKNILNKFGIPFRSAEYNYNNPPFIDPDFIADDYSRDALVYAARYGCPAYIEKSYDSKEYEKVYRIRTIGPNRQQAIQPYYELIDLRKLQTEYGLVLKEMSDDDIKMEINQTLINAKRKSKKNDA